MKPELKDFSTIPGKTNLWRSQFKKKNGYSDWEEALGRGAFSGARNILAIDLGGSYEGDNNIRI